MTKLHFEPAITETVLWEAIEDDNYWIAKVPTAITEKDSYMPYYKHHRLALSNKHLTWDETIQIIEKHQREL